MPPTMTPTPPPMPNTDTTCKADVGNVEKSISGGSKSESVSICQYLSQIAVKTTIITWTNSAKALHCHVQAFQRDKHTFLHRAWFSNPAGDTSGLSICAPAWLPEQKSPFVAPGNR